MADHNWDEAAVATLTKLWEDGLSARIIAARIGGISRMAVIGKARRLKLPYRVTTSRHTSARLKSYYPSEKPPIKRAAQHNENIPKLRALHAKMADAPILKSEPLPVFVDPEGFSPRGITLLTLEPNECRWPLGPTMAQAELFCGLQKKRGSYCEYHARMNSSGRLKPMNIPSHLTAIRSRRAA